MTTRKTMQRILGIAALCGAVAGACPVLLPALVGPGPGAAAMVVGLAAAP